MFYIMIMMIISMLIPMLIITLNYFLSMKKMKNREKITPFECGLDPLTNTRLPFSIQFFSISLLFLIFDIEIILIFPIVLLLKNIIMLSLIYSMLFLIIILITGLWMEWTFNYLKWIN